MWHYHVDPAALMVCEPHRFLQGMSGFSQTDSEPENCNVFS